jgi:hypothetical protein
MLDQYNSNIHNLLTGVQKEYQDSYTNEQRYHFHLSDTQLFPKNIEQF